MKRTTGIILLIAGIGLGILGFTKLDDSKAGIEIGNLELTAKDSGEQSQAYILLALGAVGLIGGLVMINKK